MINQLAVKEITLYNTTWLSLCIDNKPLNDVMVEKTGNSDYQALSSAWLSLNNLQEQKYIWQLLSNQTNCHLPILLCIDDLDLSCTVIIADIEYQHEVVIWKRCGLVTGAIDIVKWRESGIQNTESWSAGDWQRYGHLALLAKNNPGIWQEWWSHNWPEEESRRLKNYTHNYLNNPNNISWFRDCHFLFSKEEFEKCIQAFTCYNQKQTQI